MIASNNAPRPGFYGKLPCHGDFLHHRLPRELVDSWDHWVRNSINLSQQQLGEDLWMDRYLITPIWRLYLSAGVCGQKAWIGLMMPSVDSVGRIFPMLVANEIPPTLEPCELLVEAEAWLDATEETLLNALEKTLDPDTFERSLIPLALPERLPVTPVKPIGGGWYLPEIAQGAAWCQRIVAGALADSGAGLSLWWQQPDDFDGGGCYCFRGLPPEVEFTRLLAKT